MPRAIVRHSALDRPHTSPRHDAHSRERTRRGIAKGVRLTPNSLLPCREAILHNATNKSLLNGILYGYPLQYNRQLENKLDCIVTHAEADITLCSCMLHAASDGAQTIHILSDDTVGPMYPSFWCTRHRGGGSLPTSKRRSGMALSWTSAKLLSS